MKFLAAALSLLLTAAMIETTIADVNNGRICTSEIDVCVAIDNSGSVCTAGQTQKGCNSCKSNVDTCKAGDTEPLNKDLCCGNYETLTGFASNYIEQLESDSTTVHVVKFATDAESISETQIGTSKYTGGWTNTESALEMCIEKLENANNPVIVLISDGYPTACKDANGDTITGKYGLDCAGDNANAQEAAMAMADTAANAGVTVVPVIVTSSATALEKLHALARCPANEEDDAQDCDVEAFHNLEVSNIPDLPKILDLLVQTTCEDGGSTDPPVESTEAPVPDCAKNVKVLKTKGEEKFPEGAVKVLRTNESTVTVQLTNAWQSSLQYIFYQYKTDAFNHECTHTANALSEDIYADEITIQCMHSVKIALLEICIIEDVLKIGTDSAVIPECCGGVPDYNHAVCYHLQVHCEDQCLLETERRSLLRG